MQLALLLDLWHKPVIVVAFPYPWRGGTCLGRYQGFGHATAPGLTVGFLRTCAVGATNESYTRALAIWGRGSIGQAESALGL